MSSCWGALHLHVSYCSFILQLHVSYCNSMFHTPTGLSLKSSQGGYQYGTVLLQHWNGLMENSGKSLRLHHGSKLSESHKSGKQMLNSGKPSCHPLLSETLGQKWTNTMHIFLTIVDLLRINILQMLSWKNSEYNRCIFVGTHSLAWRTISFLMISSLTSTY